MALTLRAEPVSPPQCPVLIPSPHNSLALFPSQSISGLLAAPQEQPVQRLQVEGGFCIPDVMDRRPWHPSSRWLLLRHKFVQSSEGIRLLPAVADNIW